jgi:hypothetical protein
MMSSQIAACRALLDQLMGEGAPSISSSQSGNSPTHFSDDRICKFFICGLCPHELFINTKVDLGPCLKIHNEVAKEHFSFFFFNILPNNQARYEKLDIAEKLRYPYERELVALLQQMVTDLDRKIKQMNDRLASQAEMGSDPQGDSLGTAPRLQVCEVCGSILAVGDSEARMQMHLSGKMHKGFLQVRQVLEEKSMSAAALTEQTD